MPSQVPTASPGDGSRVFVALASDWFKCGWKIGTFLSAGLTNGYEPPLSPTVSAPVVRI